MKPAVTNPLSTELVSSRQYGGTVNNEPIIDIKKISHTENKNVFSAMKLLSKLTSAFAGKCDYNTNTSLATTSRYGIKAPPPCDVNIIMYGKSLQKTADKYGVVISIRYPSEIGQQHLKDGYPTKNFHVKAKSSDSGPTSGFITENVMYSKTPLNKKEQHEKHINEALKKGAKLVDLTLSETQIDFLKSKNLLVLTEGKFNGFHAKYHGINVYFTLDNNRVLHDDKGPVKVITNPPESDGRMAIDKPITADYDLFSIIPKASQSNNLRRLSVPPRMILPINNVTQDPNMRLAYQKAMEAFTLPRIETEPAHPDKGNVHHFTEVIINDINNNVNKEGFSGGKLVWHGDETSNPYSPGFDPKDKPIFFIPKQPPRQVFNKEQLLKLHHELRVQGYVPEYNPRF